MKQLLTNYTYNPSTTTLSFTNQSIPGQNVLLVAAKGTVLYSLADGVGYSAYTQGTTSTLTLQPLPTGLTLDSNSKFTIYYDDGVVAQNAPGAVTATGSGNFIATQSTAGSLNATVIGSGNFTATQPTAASLNATVIGSGNFTATQSTAANLNATVVQGTAANLKATALISDGTNSAAVKGASTAAATTDPALVVSVSPNTPVKLDAGANTIGNVKITDGTNTAKVVSGYQSAANDPALVVALSPNSPVVLGAGGNSGNDVIGTVSVLGVSNTVTVEGVSTGVPMPVTGNTNVDIVQTFTMNTTATGNSANPTISTVNKSVVVFQVIKKGSAGTIASYTLYPEISMDGINFVAVNYTLFPAGTTGSGNITEATALPILGEVNCSGYNTFRLRLISFVGGANPQLTVTLNASRGARSVTIDSSLPAGSSTIGKVRLTDGTNTATVKGASANAVASDLALVVSVSPNTAVKLDAGTNAIGTVKLSDSTNSAAIKGPGSPAQNTDSALVVAISPGTPVKLDVGTNTIGSVKLTDGTNSAAVKAASTAAVVTDPAMVVAVSPGTPVKLAGNNSANLVGSVVVAADSGGTDLSTLNTSLTSISTAISNLIDLSTTIWVDNTTNPNSFYVRREKTQGGSITVSWENPDGSVATPQVSKLTSVAASPGILVDSATFTVTTTGASGAGYSVGDIIIHSYGIDSSETTPSVAFNIWFNATTGATISAPTNPAHYTSAAGMSVTGNVALNAGASGGANVIGTVLIQGGNTTALKVDGSAVTQPISGNINTDTTNTGAITALGGTASITLASATSVTFSLVAVNGTFTGLNLIPELSIDGGTNWYTTNYTTVSTGVSANYITAGQLPLSAQVNCAGYTNFRLRATVFTSTATPQVNATFIATRNPGNISLASGNNNIGIVKLDTGVNTIGSVKLTDGTNVPAVKAASTAALTTDPALVVSVSPNTSVKLDSGTNSGTNIIGTVIANAGANLNTSGLALEAGGNLASINTYTNQINNKTPALGQTTMALSTPVVIASNQAAVPVSLSALPVLAAGTNAIGSITNTSFAATQSTAANLNATVVGSGSFTAAQSTAANLNATVVGSGSFTAAQSTAANLKATALISDGTNSAAVKAASTAAVATDPALVVAVSPNNTVSVSNATVTIAEYTTALTAGTASTIFTSKTNRKYLAVQNTSQYPMYLRIDGTAAIGTGFYLAPYGGSYIADGFSVPNGSVSLICASVGTYYAIQG